MTDKRFTETFSTGVVTDHITGKKYKCEMRIDDKLLELLNELHEENQSLKSKHMKMLDFIEEKGTVTVNDIKQWWNTTR